LKDLKMNAQQFRESLHLGLGRGILYVRDHDVSEYRDVILDACLHCYSYDVQVEGTRADYMYELVRLLPDKAFYHDAVLSALAGSGDDNDAVQRFRFALRLSMDGHEYAKRMMHESYNPGPSRGESIGMNFLDMDGIQGLLFIAERMGAVLLAKPGESDIGWIINRSKEEFGEQAAWDALRDAGRNSPNIEAYRIACEASEAELHRKDPIREEIRAMSYAELLDRVPNKFSLLWTWGKQASDQELELAARGLLAAQDPKEKLRHLRIFNRRLFPLRPDTLITLAEGEDRLIGFNAMRALAHVSDPAVRALAFRIVKSDTGWRGEAIALLNKNFEPGDHEIVLGWFEAEQDREIRHSFGTDLREFWKQHPDEGSEVQMLKSLYENSPCSHCREFALKRLIELNALTEEMRAECAYDANDDIRDLVGATALLVPKPLSSISTIPCEYAPQLPGCFRRNWHN